MDSLEIHEAGHVAYNLLSCPAGTIVEVVADDEGLVTNNPHPPIDQIDFFCRMVSGAVYERMRDGTFVTAIQQGWREVLSTPTAKYDLEQLEMFNGAADRELIIACARAAQVLTGNVTQELIECIGKLQPGDSTHFCRNPHKVH